MISWKAGIFTLYAVYQKSYPVVDPFIPIIKIMVSCRLTDTAIKSLTAWRGVEV